MMLRLTLKQEKAADCCYDSAQHCCIGRLHREQCFCAVSRDLAVKRQHRKYTRMVSRVYLCMLIN